MTVQPSIPVRDIAAVPDLASLVPHTGAMVLLERVAHWDADAILCLTTTHRAADNPLRRDGVLPAVAAAEYGAQAMAAHGGLLGAATGGLLVSLRDLRMHVRRLDDVPGPLTVKARMRLRDAGSSIYNFALRAAGHDLATGQAAVLFTAESGQANGGNGDKGDRP